MKGKIKLEEIGFYTLSDKRASEVSWESDLQRCELILTSRCNFKCPYCRGIKKELQGDLTLKQAKEMVDIWASGNLHNIRLSGGEPTIWESLVELVEYAKSKPSVERVAISTNGSASLDFYQKLFEAGVSDFSISLDACCGATFQAMAGTTLRLDHVCKVIRFLSEKTYVTVGVVLDKQNNHELNRIIDYATSLGVSDIRIIPSAQSNHSLDIDVQTEYKILKYRIDNFKNGRHVRGIREWDCRKCHLVKDDMVILYGEHFPCVIFMREQGQSIGSVNGKSLEHIRSERKVWFENMDTHKHEICRNNCLDVCVDHNNKVEELSGMAKP